ncbi:pentapeptide repeat-containing protein [Campylobacter lari]|uniref:pentapeptide repeat-containing protein n=1 Tax=Campylobacter lari TaxID=201 RepID=UPI002152722B|nr:pentapeptide repeat-containing protein [Campylobacter lari]MCR6558802.1 pentapeptide repeat-containing protein [Campylobacter lari]
MKIFFFNTIFRDEVSFDSAVFEGRVEFVHSIFKDNVSFLKAKFLYSYSFNQPVKFINSSTQNEIIENNFYAITVLGDANFSNAMFKGKTDFSMSNFKGKVGFINTEFLAIQNNIIENNFLWTIFKDNVSFNSVKIKSKISFEFSSFNEKFEFTAFNSLKGNLIFNGINFKKAKFNFLENNTNEGIKITNSNFTEILEIENINIGESDFQNVVFGGIVIFNEINQTNKIQKKANFINCTFSNQFNIKHDYIQYDYNELEEKIEKNKNNYDEFLNFRDLFRKLKSNRIAHHNLIDASELRVQELYARELELKYKENKSLKEKIERWQLIFYRKLCDHHTDLLKVFHNLLIIIMLFSVFSFVFDKFKQPSIENNAKYHIVQVDTNESYIFKEHNKTTYNIFGLNINKESGKLDEFIKNNFVYILILLFIVLPILSFNIFTNLYIFGSFFYVIFNFLDLVALYTHIAIISLFVFFALKFILFDDKQEIIRKIIIGVSYIVCIFALLVKPSLMLPVFGSFLEKDSNATYPLLFSLSVVYFILVALVIFSLQKTARKNSIVPS